ncbi:MAG: hypothetical protein M0R47_17170 [Methylobacter sp.]|jgi:hypothetical protein|uniref:hypothetical protein n=1 Tax=Methylobacter sp. TaxID=2051955 RepID=UPI0025DED7EE|nr:hypothetical protein [Methylobacter sp.]MCK9622256.1 hypothetical protein [Methylobacter sp.]
MNRKSKLEAMAHALCGKVPTLLEQCEALEAENRRLFQELKDQYIKNALLEYQLTPKKRGRKPNPKPEIKNPPKKPGKPPVFSDKTLKLMIECVDVMKERDAFKTDKEALIEIMIQSGRYKSKWRAESEVNKLQTQLSKARKKLSN